MSKWNFRHIFGTDTEKDRHYNTPRVWYAQRYLNPEDKQEPESMELPFIRKANRKISVEDVQYILKSHFNETEYDPLGTGTEAQKTTYRAISLSRTANAHIVQIRNNVPEAVRGVQWLGFGVPAFNPYVPFFANANDTDISYREVPEKMDLTSAYWLNEALAMVVESHYKEFKQEDIDYQKALSQWARTKIAEVDEVIAEEANPVEFLTAQNHEIAKYYNKTTHDFLMQLMTEGTEFSKLTFKMDKNL